MSNIIKASSIKLDNISVFDYKEHEPKPPEDYSSDDSEIIEVIDAPETEEEAEDDFLYNKELEEEVRVRIENILNNAHVEAEEIKKTAGEEGYKEGYNIGMNDANKFKANIEHEYTEKLRIEKDKLHNENDNYIKSLESNILDIIIKFSKKVIKESLDLDKKLLLDIIISGLVKITDVDQLTIRTSKEDYDTVSENKAELQKYFDSNVKLNILIDEKMKKGDCIIDTPYGIVDCGVDTKINSIIEQMKKVVSY